MWLMTPRGFYSAVQHNTNRDLLVVRTRDRGDAESLKDWYQTWTEDVQDLAAQAEVEAPAVPDAVITTYEHSDYPWRVILPRGAWAAFVAEAVEDLDYGNFKDAVKVNQGYERAAVYTQVWAALLRIEDLDPHGRPQVWMETVDDEPWDEYDAWEAGAPYSDDEPADWDDDGLADPTPIQMAAYQEYLAQAARDSLRCRTCGTNNAERECPDWCAARAGTCGCGRSDCGECMRYLGTSNSGFGTGTKTRRAQGPRR